MASKFNSSDFVNPLEQFLLSARSTKGPAAVELIKQVLETSNVFSFSLLLKMPNVVELADGPYASYYDILQIFTYGTYQNYIERKDSLPELTAAQLKKLRLLTIVSASTKEKYVPYTTLLKEIGLNNVRDLEDLIMEAIYVDLIQGKLDQKYSRLEVNFCVARDFKPDDLATIIYEINAWSETVGLALEDMNTQIKNAMLAKQKHNNHKVDMGNRIIEIKKQLKLQCQDELLLREKADSLCVILEKAKKSARAKGLRSSMKLTSR